MKATLWLLAALASVPAWAQPDYVRMTSNGLQRQYILVTPATSARAPIPLIVFLHGTVGTGRKMLDGLDFDERAVAEGYAVAYPDAYTEPGRRRTTRWNDGRDTLASTRLHVDDVAFLRDMVRHIGQRIAVDPARVFVTGPSNGGIMAYRAACEAADLFAAAAPVIGNVAVSLRDSCRPSRPISVLAINGTEDPFVPFEGGTVCKNIRPIFCERGEVISSIESLRIFARRDGCDPNPREEPLPARVREDPAVTAVTFDHCRGGHRVGAFWLRGGGHNWPPNPGQLGDRNGRASHNLDATDAILSFFSKTR